MVLLVILLGLLLVADRVGVSVASRAAASQLQKALRTAHQPAVELGGFPFLTQVLSGRYDRVEVRAGQASAAGVTLTTLDATLVGARVPPSQALLRTVAEVPVEQLRVRGTVSYAELARLADERLDLAPSAAGLSLSPAGDRVQVTGTVEALGQTVVVTALSRVEVVHGDLLVTAESYRVGGTNTDPRIIRALDDRLDVRVPVEGLPSGLQVRQVQVRPEGLSVLATAVDVMLWPR